MYWNNFADFVAMGQHGIYVWSALLVMAALMILEPILLIRGHKSVVMRLRWQVRAEESGHAVHSRGQK